MTPSFIRTFALVASFVSFSAGATSHHTWEGTDCKAQVAKITSEESTADKSDELLAECEKDKHDHAKKRKTRRGEGRIYRGRAK